MTFITYVFLGLCLPMAALCAGQECACSFPSKLLVEIETYDDLPDMLYIDSDKKFAVERTNNPPMAIAYDMKTMTRYEMDVEFPEAGCSTSTIADDISKYQCIPKDADKTAVFGSSTESEYSVINYEEGTGRTYHVVPAKEGGGMCHPVDVVFESIEDRFTVSYNHGDLRVDFYETLYGRIIKFCKEN